MSRRSAKGVALFVMVLLMGGWWAAVAAQVDQALVAAGLQPIFQESRCGFDPNGQPLPCAGAAVDSRCGFDPDGNSSPCASM